MVGTSLDWLTPLVPWQSLQTCIWASTSAEATAGKPIISIEKTKKKLRFIAIS